jgi:hypothetical protein
MVYTTSFTDYQAFFKMVLKILEPGCGTLALLVAYTFRVHYQCKSFQLFLTLDITPLLY